MVLGGGLVEDLLVVEAGQTWLHVVLLSHFEVLAEVLVSAPPVEVDHAEALAPEGLVEVGVAHVVFDLVDGHSPVLVPGVVVSVSLANLVLPVLDHLLLLVLHQHPQQERLV